MSQYETIEFEIKENIAIISLNRPDVYNALNRQMYKDLLKAIKECGRNEQIRAVILTGNGKGFCSGADLIELNGLIHQGISVGDALREGLNLLMASIRQLEKPVICALNGVAAGAGSSLALACDFRIASENASFVFAAFVNIGIIPDGGLTYLLPQIVGTNRALELILTADAQNRLKAEDALKEGLINRLVAAETLMSETEVFAMKLAHMATKAIGMSKRAIYKSPERSLVEAMEYEAQVQEGAFKTEDFAEGVQAFIEKRPAHFKGR